MSDEFQKKIQTMGERLGFFPISPLRMPDFTYGIPKFKLPKIPTIEEQRSFESSAELIKNLAFRIRQWRSNLPQDAQPVILAILANGVSINVRNIGTEGHNGVVIFGIIDKNECMVLAHQANIQLLCFIEKVEDGKKYKIGFHVDGQDSNE